jgi:NADH:ubiquinone oxidoreductase subunit D
MEMVKRPLPAGFQKVSGDDNTEEYFINMGPQHPATHGVLRLVLRLDGETVRECVPHLGYIHRGIEKQAESETYLQYVHLTDRMDYLTSHMNNHSVCMAIEKAVGIGVPDRAEYIRVMVLELNRISSHLMMFGCFGGDLGAQTALLYGFKEREVITDIFDELCGARLTMNYFRPGGVANDIPDTFIARVKKVIVDVERTLEEFDRLITGNVIIQERSRGIGILTREDAIAYGCTGCVLRASGVPYDLRKDDPYSIYDRLDFDVPTKQNGDSFDRYVIHIDEIRQSIRILQQCIEQIPEGPYRSKEKPSYRLPAGSYYAATETAKGIFGTYVVAEKGDKPWRIHSRSPNFANLSPIGKMVKGHMIADVVTVITTLDILIPDIDR